MSDVSTRWDEAIVSLLRISHLAQPSAFSSAVNEAARGIGVETTVYVSDREQQALRQLPAPGQPVGEPLSIDASLAGRAFRQLALTVSPDDESRAWLPILDGTERLGVLSVKLPDGESAHDQRHRMGLETFAMLIGHLIAVKLPYGDSIRRARRSQRMTVAGELLWRNLPPLTFTTHNMVLSTVIQPCYDVGGDGFDYAVDDDRAKFVVFDAVGHDLRAGVTATVALAAIRSARIAGVEFSKLPAEADRVLLEQFSDLRYVTAVLAELDLRTGRLRLINAGHPAPVHLRSGRTVTTLDGGRRLPLGMHEEGGSVAEVALEPNDLVLFYTDGITEGRDDDGAFFGPQRLAQFAEHEIAAGYPTAEVVRRLANAVLEHQHGELHDDATLMIIQWGPGVGRREIRL